MKLEEIKPGVLVAGSKWPEPVEVNKVENFGNYLRLVGATKSGKHIDQVISLSDLNAFNIVQVGIDFSTEIKNSQACQQPSEKTMAVLPTWPDLPPTGTTPTTNIPAQPASEISGLQITLDIPRGQVSQMMGLMNFLQQKYQKLNIQITATDGTMSDNELSDHIKETLKQLGINPEKAISTRNQ